MIGVFLALVYAAFQYFFNGQPLTTILPIAAVGLHYWYTVCAVLMGLLMLISTILLIVVLPIQARRAYNRLGSVLGFTGAATISVLIWIWYAIKYVSLIYGTYLLSISWTGTVWDQNHLIFGGLLLILGLLLKGNAKITTTNKKTATTYPSITSARPSWVPDNDDLPDLTSDRLRNTYHRCPNCHSRVDDDDPDCPQCGAPQGDS